MPPVFKPRIHCWSSAVRNCLSKNNLALLTWDHHLFKRGGLFLKNRDEYLTWHNNVNSVWSIIVKTSMDKAIGFKVRLLSNYTRMTKWKTGQDTTTSAFPDFRNLMIIVPCVLLLQKSKASLFIIMILPTSTLWNRTDLVRMCLWLFEIRSLETISSMPSIWQSERE